MELYERILKLAKEQNLSILALERTIGLNRGSINSWKLSKPSADKLQKVADYFEVSQSFLLTGEEEKRNANDYRNFLKEKERILFDLVDGATVEEIEQTVQFLKFLRSKE